ncbi:MAG: cupin domain-containing protein [Candidatus Kapabacteria bacterium]|nr:cupin domain-containing protein [Candidatus Kapabacteria bacterium]
MSPAITVASPLSIAESLTEFWSPHIIGEVDDSYIKVAKVKGEFVWHQHENEDEFFLVLKGSFEIQLEGSTIVLAPGESVVIPKGVLHCPRAEDECLLLIIERKSTLHTGGVASELTKSIEQQMTPDVTPGE